MIDPEDRVHVPVVGLVVAALVTLAFVVGAFDALMSNHFTSWNHLTLRPTNDLARTLEGLMPTARWVSMLGAAAFGATTLQRSAAQGLRIGLTRLALVAFSPIVIEVLDAGTQDGQVPDLEKLPAHSVVLVVVITFLPALAAARDAYLLRTRLRGTGPPTAD